MPLSTAPTLFHVAIFSPRSDVHIHPSGHGSFEHFGRIWKAANINCARGFFLKYISIEYLVIRPFFFLTWAGLFLCDQV